MVRLNTFYVIPNSLFNSKHVLYKILPMTGFEQLTSGNRSDCSAN